MKFLEVHRVVHVVPLGPRLCEDAPWLVIILIFLLLLVAISAISVLILFQPVRTCPSAVGLIPLVLRLLLNLERVDLPLVVALLPILARRLVAVLQPATYTDS